jgi:alkylation response protein AidB-like acyl-CoA dehydrogenase
MKLQLTQDCQRFRAELCELLDTEEFAKVTRSVSDQHGDPDPRPIHRALGERGWLAPHWPRRYGGIDADADTLGVLTEELALRGIPDSAHVNTIRNAGTALLMAGDDAQRQRFLPPLASGDALMAVLYSEPDAGSDLAALSSTARRQDGSWVVSGTKIYSVKTAAADYGLVAVRTSEHANKLVGITLFVVDLNADGVTVEPIETMNVEPFYQVRFTDVVVEDDRIVGPVDGGWLVVTEALAMERVGVDFNAKIHGWLSRIRRAAERRGRDSDPLIRQRLSELETCADAGRALAWEMAHRLRDGDLDPAEAAASKWFSSELGPRVARLALDICGPDGLAAGECANEMLREAPGLTLSAGTSEMMLYVVATQLGLWGEDDE